MHLREHTRLMQHVLEAFQKCDADEACDVPRDLNLPLKSVRELRALEAALEDEDKTMQLVSVAILYCLINVLFN